MDDEPVGYLGGAQGQDVDGDPYADPYGGDGDPYADPYAGGDDPYADAAEEEVAGYLGGAPPAAEELPALPAQEDPASYSHRDFMGADDGYADDGYTDEPGGAPEEDYQDPYALPPESDDYAAGYDDYGSGYENAEYEGYGDYGAGGGEDDASYFDSMGHDDDYGAPPMVATAPAMDQPTETYDDDAEVYDDSPKTISQQDAESIIRRITTKRILPADTEAPPAPLTQPRLTQAGGGGLRIWPILVVFLILGAGTVYVFRQPIAHQFPALAGVLGVEIKEEVVEEVIEREDPKVTLKRAMLEKVLMSEAKAFGASMEELKPPAAPLTTAGQGGE